MANDQTLTPIRYHFATTRKLLDLAANLDDAAFFDKNGYSADGIHGTLAHVVIVANAWRTALETGTQRLTIERSALATLAGLRAYNDTEEQAWIAHVSALNDEAIAAKREFITYRGDTVHLHVWQVLQQVVLHGMQHHSELAKLLTDKGHSPGNIDFLFYVR